MKLRDPPFVIDVGLQGKKEFDNFVEKTYRGLIEFDERHFSRLDVNRPTFVSDIRVFCRVDVGVMKVQGLGYQYFVNDISTSESANLGLKYVKSPDGICMDLAATLRGAVAYRRV